MARFQVASCGLLFLLLSAAVVMTIGAPQQGNEVQANPKRKLHHGCKLANRDNCCYVQRFTNGVQQCLPPVGNATAVGEFLAPAITHIAVVVKTDWEYNYQLAAFQSAGIGPWTNLSLALPATYCGEEVFLDASVQINSWVLTGSNATYFEVFKFNGKNKTFFSDYYKVHGPSILYYGSLKVQGKTKEQVRAFLKAQNIPVIFSFDSPATGAVDWVRVGFAYTEIVYFEV